jgi:hypothetical protein
MSSSELAKTAKQPRIRKISRVCTPFLPPRAQKLARRNSVLATRRFKFKIELSIPIDFYTRPTRISTTILKNGSSVGIIAARQRTGKMISKNSTLKMVVKWWNFARNIFSAVITRFSKFTVCRIV